MPRRIYQSHRAKHVIRFAYPCIRVIRGQHKVPTNMSTHSQDSTFRTFPVEVFEHIINFLDPWWTADRDALLACCLSCRAWLPESRHRLFSSITLNNSKDLGHFSKLITGKGYLADFVSELTVEIDKDPYSSRSKVFGSFPFVLARRLEKVSCLHIRCSGNIARVPPVLPYFPLLLSEFTSITRLEIGNVHFSSLLEFSRLVGALPNLSLLACDYVRWTNSKYTQGTATRCKPHLRVTRLLMNYMDFSSNTIKWLLSTISANHLHTIILPSLTIQDTGHVSRIMEAAGTSLRCWSSSAA
ncbi:hypothetical protein AcV7_002025 [Taiwanofungus camphoratus]|nr:hypothetical protein AcV7_002025 [Antrodia cinnamomea]